MKHVLLARHGPFIFHTLSFHYGNCDRRPLPNSLYFLPSVFCRFMATNDAPIDHVFNSKLFNHNNMLWNNWSRFCIYVDHYLQLQLLPLTQEDLWRRNCAVTRPSTSNIEVVGVACMWRDSVVALCLSRFQSLLSINCFGRKWILEYMNLYLAYSSSLKFVPSAKAKTCAIQLYLIVQLDHTLYKI